MERIESYFDVRFVPNLKRDLISLGTLNALGYKFRTLSGSLQVTKEGKVVMKGRK